MFRLIVLATVVSVVVGGIPQIRSGVPMLDGRIVGGESTDIEEFPYQLSMEFRNSHSCGASIISENRVLTAAHCTYRRAAYDLTIRAGSSRRGSGGQTRAVREICQHPYYNSWKTDNDVSVLILAKALTFGPGIQPVDLISAGEYVPIGTPAVVTGWGALSTGGSSPTQLQYVTVPRVSDEYCKAAYGASKISNTMICFGLENGGKDSCQGDSGGPLVANQVQVGVVSWGYGCAAPNYPGVYAKVSELLDHIYSC